MTVRKLSLQEWFLYYQLKKIRKTHFSLPGVMQIEMKRITKYYQEQGKRVPITPIIIKAASMVAREHPEINQQFFETIFGAKMLDFPYIAVNVPVMMEIEGESYLSAMVIKEADQLTISEIKSQIKNFKNSKKEDLKIGKFIIGKSNNIFTRLRLKIVHFLISNLPHLQEKFGAGSISVSSLLMNDSKNPNINIKAEGHNAITICATTFDTSTSRLNLSLSWDHYTGHGMKFISAADRFSSILEAKEDKDFETLIN